MTAPNPDDDANNYDDDDLNDDDDNEVDDDDDDILSRVKWPEPTCSTINQWRMMLPTHMARNLFICQRQNFIRILFLFLFASLLMLHDRSKQSSK